MNPYAANPADFVKQLLEENGFEPDEVALQRMRDYAAEPVLFDETALEELQPTDQKEGPG